MTWLLALGLPAICLTLFWFAPRCLDAWLDDALVAYRARERDEQIRRDLDSLPREVCVPYDWSLEGDAA